MKLTRVYAPKLWALSFFGSGLFSAVTIAAFLAAHKDLAPKIPAETTPLTALLFADVLRQAELPPGVVNIVTGDGRTGACPRRRLGLAGGVRPEGRARPPQARPVGVARRAAIVAPFPCSIAGLFWSAQ